MNCAALQSRRESPDAGVFPPEYDVANGGVVEQHCDHDVTVE